MFIAAFAYNSNNWKQISMTLRVVKAVISIYQSINQSILIWKAIYDILSGKSKLKDQYTDNIIYRKKAKLYPCRTQKVDGKSPQVSMPLTRGWGRVQRDTHIFFP